MSPTMCRKLALAATALSLLVGPAVAAEKQKPAKAAKAEAVQAAALPVRKKATPDQRAAAERMDPLARAAFWAHEIETDPNDADAALKLAMSLRQLGQHQQAAETAQKILVAQPGNYEALLELARDYIGAGKGFYAIEPARRAQALRPKDWKPLSLLGIALEQAERPEEADAAYRQALAIAPDNPAVLANLAMFRASQGKGAEAESLLRKAVAQPGATIQIRQNLSLVLGLNGKLAEAEQLIRQDLPPEMVSNNIAYLREAAGAQKPASGARSWESLRSAQDGG